MLDASSKRKMERFLLTSRVAALRRERIQRSTVPSESRSIGPAAYSSVSMCIIANRDAFQILFTKAE